MRFFIITLLFLLLFAGISFAANAGDTSSPDLPYGSGICNWSTPDRGALKASFDGEWVFDRDLDAKLNATSADIEGQKYLFRIGYTFFNRVEPYAKLGVSHLRMSWNEAGSDIKLTARDGFAVGGGGKVLVFEIPDYKIRLSADGHYLYTEPGIKKINVDDVTRSVSAQEFKVAEWQIAGIISMEFPLSYDRYNPASVYSLIPYVGVAYFDSDIKAKFTYNSNEYSVGDAENKDKILLIGGLDFTSPQNMVFNVEGRFIGETAASSGLTVKF
jgi:opacity protein-like surface antigen